MTDFHITGRAEGKTTELLEWLRAEPEDEVRVIACMSVAEVRRLQREAPDVEFWRFVTWDEVRRGVGLWSGVRGNVVLGVDNADLMLAEVFRPWRVGRVTATGELV